MEKQSTIFCDIDGTIFKYRKFGTYEDTPVEVIPSTLDYLNKEREKGTYIILTSARPEEMITHTIKELIATEVPFDKLILGIGRGPRIVINDMDPDNDEPRALAINLIRDQGIKSI